MAVTLKQQWFRTTATDITKAKRRAKKDGVTLANVLRALMSGYANGNIDLDDAAYSRILQQGNK